MTDIGSDAVCHGPALPDGADFGRRLLAAEPAAAYDRSVELRGSMELRPAGAPPTPHCHGEQR